MKTKRIIGIILIVTFPIWVTLLISLFVKIEWIIIAKTIMLTYIGIAFCFAFNALLNWLFD